jgi:hypothetical protein
MTNEQIRDFLRSEINNERDGGVCPATFGSALDSLQQWPDDAWEERFGSRDGVERYLRTSIEESGADGELRYVPGV